MNSTSKKSWNAVIRKEPIRIINSSTWLHIGTSKSQILPSRSNISWIPTGLVLWPLSQGACSTTQPHSGEELFPNPQPDPPMRHLHQFPRALPLSPESRTQRCPSAPFMRGWSCHEASTQTALLWAEQTKGYQLLLIHPVLSTFHYFHSSDLDVL